MINYIVLLVAMSWLQGVPVSLIEAEKEITCLAENIYFEARNQSEEGQIAVSQVTLNRVSSSKDPDTICKVVKEPKQFSWFWDGKSDEMTNLQAKITAYKIAVGSVLNLYENKVENARFYHTVAISPYWASKFKLIRGIEDHLFYEN